ncbi:MAG: RNA polymerase sigma-70 factor [Petrimonas sp.]|uniref:RNA polymerase sigma-70 factor n=1 Tax=Petrimonas sp. TaxID=2023866 RepID=UPI002B37712A|nr:RNA polymerase sigma-70 factor [Petrimonas sp.]MEA4979262.1 RNA polymerase sigma-70 factor [Petrimonas sp.]MEA5045079.1 RNA polymerase sigma-70 factor [Petrimonas sp.]MEA5062183.1 RNA polymerase sigma-70 factor [Petrimonas sp.]
MMDLFNNSDLFNEVKKGNEKAFEYAYKRFYYRLKGFALGFVEDRDVVDDIIQECFLTLWEKRERLASISLSSLLFTMVRNSCLNHLKHISIKNKHISVTHALSEIEERLYYVDFELDASQKLLYEELDEQVNKVIEALPERCKEVFVLSRNEGLKNREIAERLKISTTAVEKHINKALTIFSFHLKERYPIDYTFFFLIFSYLLPA